MSRKEHNTEEIAKIIERENVISYKRKGDQKHSMKYQKQDEEEIESAQSLKSGVFSDDSNRINKKNTPLPELSKDRRKYMVKNFMAESKNTQQPYFEKEVRQHDNLMLKQKNNFLTSENMKLKTKIMVIEKENLRIQKLLEDDSNQKGRTNPSGSHKEIRFKGSESASVKIAMKNLRKELEEVRKENSKMKWSVKFTTISELEIEREAIIEETNRLRQLLEEEQNRRMFLKANQQGSQYDQKMSQMHDKNQVLSRENNELKGKLSRMEDGMKGSKFSENEKNLNKMLFNARRTIKEKEKELEHFRLQLKGKSEGSGQSIGSLSKLAEAKEGKPESDKYRGNVGTRNFSKEKRVMSKSAQKYRTKDESKNSAANSCGNCKKLLEQNNILLKEIQDLSDKLKTEQDKGNFRSSSIGEISKGPINVYSTQEIQKISRYLCFRFKAHHLGIQESEKYLINSEVTEEELQKTVTVPELVENLIAEPFSVITNRYIQICVQRLMLNDSQLKGKTTITIQEDKTVKKRSIIEKYKTLIKQFQLIPQTKEEQMFIQIAELVTNYHQHILTALNSKKNGEGTIEQGELIGFFKEIELEDEYIDFIITQIILESVDLDHLNYYALFQIFYMPTNDQAPQEEIKPTKKKYNMIQSVVKEEDEEYEESRSHVEARQKTVSRKDSELADNDHAHQEDKIRIGDTPAEGGTNMVEEYEESFEEEKMNRVPEEEKINQEVKKSVEKPYVMEEALDDYEEDYEQQ